MPKEHETYTKIKTLANQGAYGKVDLMRANNSGIKVIQKTIDMTKMDEKGKELAMQEVKLHKKMSHPHIVKMMDSFKTNNGKLRMITQYAERIDLKH
jgi:serine/threonine protein kinase|tara:strand:- start:221 stop:511 length:291 start_codon:yes stop_codon:yes gene_type:complete